MRRALLVVLAVILGGAVAFVILTARGNSVREENTFRVRATATVLVDGIERTGSAVQEYMLQWINEPQIGRSGAWRLLARGEAIRIDVPEEQPIYVQLGAGTLFYSCADRANGPDAVRSSLLNLESCQVEGLPTAVRFADHENPRSAIAVHADGTDWNGYVFKLMTFEKTSEPITDGKIPSSLWTDPRLVIEIPYGGKTQLSGNLSFKTEEFR